MEALVSVIMNCFNGEKYLKEAIDSVLNQTYSNWEIILWDNQSTDNSEGIVKSFNDNRIKYFYSEKFTILGEARNRALSKAKGEFIAILDCDDLWYSTKLEKQIACFSNPNVGIVTCDTYFFNESNIVKQKYKYSKPVTGNAFKYLLLNALSFETVVIRKSILNKLETNFDNRFTLINDFDFIARISYISELAFVDEVLAKWRIHNSSLTWDKHSLFPLEKRQFIKKMNLEINGFSIKYKDEVDLMFCRIIFQEAIILWKKKSSKHVIRKKLRPFVYKNKRLFLLYIIIHIMPVSVYNRLIGFKNGLI